MSECTSNTGACMAALEAALGEVTCAGHAGAIQRKGQAEAKRVCLVEASSGIRYRNGKVEPGILYQMFQRFLSIEHLPKMASTVKPVDTVGIIIQRHVDTGTNGMSYLKWMLSDLLDNSVACFLQGDVMDDCKQMAPGVVVAIFGAAWGNKGQLKVKEVGWSFDFAYCAGKKKNGERCRNCVNKTKSEFCDWHLSQGHKRLAFGARPECAGTVLGATTYQPGKEREQFANRGKIMTKKVVPKTLAQMDKHAKEYCVMRSGSRGAKAINQFVEELRVAEKRKEMKRKEAKLYRSPERPSNPAAAKTARTMPRVVAPLGEHNR